MRVVLGRIAALTRRDLTIELSYRFQLAMHLIAIVIGVLTFYFLGLLVGDSPELARYDAGYFEFALIGLLVMNFSVVSVMSFGRSIQAAQTTGTFEILLSTPTSLPTLMVGTLVVPMLFAVAEASVYLILGLLLVGFSAPLGSLLLAAILLLLTLGTFAAIGILSAAVIILTKRGDPFSGLVLQVSNLLAGAIFPVTLLPDALQVASRLVPAFYGLRGTREVLLAGGGPAEVAVDIGALVVFNAVLFPVALVALSRAIHLARITGTLGNR
jgi:ABC-2 type transport system permease protein